MNKSVLDIAEFIPYKLTIPVERNPLLAKVLKLVNEDAELQSLWHILNVTAIDRLEMTDHGPVHFQLVSNIALKLARLLSKKKVVFSVVKDFGLSYEHAEVIIFLSSVMHDLGMSIHRKNHEEFSLIVSQPILQRILSFLPIEIKTVIIAETLHAIISHRRDGNPITIEAGIVRVADALDMTKGRSRIPYEQGKIDIHSVSAQAIDKIEISSGNEHKIKIDIIMNHTAGVFQADDLLHEKIKGSGIEDYLDVAIYIKTENGIELLKDVFPLIEK